jgi:hypothetical protein
METDGINALNPAPDVGGVLPPQINAPGPLASYFTRPMVPSPASRRRDALKGIAQFVPFLGGAIAKAEGDKLGMALSSLDALGPAVKGAVVLGKAGKKGILAYHGSPYKFDEFDLDKMYSGSGSAAFGEGIYLADNIPTAQYYAGPTFQRQKAMGLKPNIYEVELNANKSDFLDFDKTIAEQPKKLQKKLEPLLKSKELGKSSTPQFLLRSNEITEQELKKAGIAGLKYEDSLYRHVANLKDVNYSGFNEIENIARRPQTNYVVFDPKNLKINKTVDPVKDTKGILALLKNK